MKTFLIFSEEYPRGAVVSESQLNEIQRTCTMQDFACMSITEVDSELLFMVSSIVSEDL